MSTTAIKERPIIFSAPMVRAILAGKKTQTRRIIKPQPLAGQHSQRITVTVDDLWQAEATDQEWRCPYGNPGDRLWVKEQWRVHGDDLVPSSTSTCTGPKDCEYGADFSGRADSFDYDIRRPWRKSISMPRWASRITLEITDIRVQKLHEIAYADAIAEGFEDRIQFRFGWHKINGEASWLANPLVWAIAFKRIGAIAAKERT